MSVPASTSMTAAAMSATSCVCVGSGEVAKSEAQSPPQTTNRYVIFSAPMSTTMAMPMRFARSYSKSPSKSPMSV